jgi:glucan-binding YG repeat protein
MIFDGLFGWGITVLKGRLKREKVARLEADKNMVQESEKKEKGAVKSVQSQKQEAEKHRKHKDQKISQNDESFECKEDARCVCFYCKKGPLAIRTMCTHFHQCFQLLAIKHGPERANDIANERIRKYKARLAKWQSGPKGRKAAAKARAKRHFLREISNTVDVEVSISMAYSSNIETVP